jgi:hypothetical protein
MPNWCRNVVHVSHENPAQVNLVVEEPTKFFQNAIEVEVVRHDALNVSVYFDTAWEPSFEIYSALKKLGFLVEAYWYEPNMMFCGVYDDGDFDNFDIEETTPDWIKKHIPRDINETFGLLDEFAEYS